MLTKSLITYNFSGYKGKTYFGFFYYKLGKKKTQFTGIVHSTCLT